MQTQLKIEGWPALVTLGDACRYLSLGPRQFRSVVEKWRVYPVAIDDTGEAVVWRLRDLDQLIKRLPSVPLLPEDYGTTGTVRLDHVAIEQIARAVVSRLEAHGGLQPQPQRRFVTVKEAGMQLSLGRSTIYRLINEGKLDVRRVGNRTLVSQSSIEALTEQ